MSTIEREPQASLEEVQRISWWIPNICKYLRILVTLVRRKTKDEGAKTKDGRPKTKDEGEDQRPKTQDQRRKTKDEGAKTKGEGDQRRKTKDERRSTKDEIRWACRFFFCRSPVFFFSPPSRFLSRQNNIRSGGQKKDGHRGRKQNI